MLIGHQTQLDFLRRSLDNGRLVHAYLFVGPEGVGKTGAVRKLASWLLGRPEEKIDLAHDFQIKYVDREYDEKTGRKHKDISIKQIHSIREFLSYHSFGAAYKIVIINDAERMNQSAGNALLKTLEEPSPRSLIILLSLNEKNLLPTIVSRCQLIRFYPLAAKEIYEALVERGVKRDLALEVSRLSFGSPGRAWELAGEPEKLKFFQNERERFGQLFKGDLSSRFSQLADLFSLKEADHIENRDRLAKILEFWLGLWRDILVCRQGAEELAANLSFQEEIKKQIKKYNNSKVTEIINQIEQSLRFLRQNINPRLIFENLVLSFY